MGSASDQTRIVVTGAGGHIGGEVCRQLKNSGLNLLALDLSSESANDLVACDLRKAEHIARIFQSNSVSAVIHLAGILPSAFQRDPLTGVDVNVNGSVELLRQAAKAGTKRLVFASSMSVYGSSASTHPLTEMTRLRQTNHTVHQNAPLKWWGKRSQMGMQSNSWLCASPE